MYTKKTYFIFGDVLALQKDKFLYQSITYKNDHA